MNKTKVKILDIEIEGEILERSYFSKSTSDETRVWTDMLAIELDRPIQLTLDSDPPPVSIYRSGSWIDGEFIGMPVPPRYKRIFVLVRKEIQEG